MDEYLGKVKHRRVFESINADIERRYGRVFKKRLNTNECLNQYGRVLNKDTDEYQNVKHIREFESIQMSIKRRYGRVSRKF